MIDRDDIARAVSSADALAEEIGFEGALDRLGVDLAGVMYVGEQRALRVAQTIEGKDPRRDSQRVHTVHLTPSVNRLMPALESTWTDGFLAGRISKHDPADDIPGIDHERVRAESDSFRASQSTAPVGGWIVGVTDPPLNLRRFATEDEAVAFVGTLEGVEDGIYYIDPPTSED